MFHVFLSENRSAILSMVHKKALVVAQKKSSSDILSKALPIFLDYIIKVLKRDSELPKDIQMVVSMDSASEYGRELLRLGYTISQVVHLYGIVCQSVTEVVGEKNFAVSGAEFRSFNLCFDNSIAAAVTEYEKAKSENLQRNDSEKLGFLIHELRNMVTSAHLSLQMIRNGMVGISGSTGGVLERSLNRMRELIDRTLDEIRSKTNAASIIKLVRLIDVVGDVEANILNEAESKQIKILVEVDPEVEVRTNQNDLFSALSNLVQNAVKFTHQGGNVWVRSKQTEENEILEIEDQCGGLPEDKLEELFNAFVQVGKDKSGLGLGLTIAQRAIQFHNGKISVKNIPNEGCIFSILFPRIKPLDLKRKKA